MLSAVFLPFALVHFITFAILIHESSARQIFDFTVFPEKPTSCQLFTFLSHISLLKHNAATYFYKPNDAVYKDGLSGCFTQIIFFVTALIHTAVYILKSSWSIQNLNHSIPFNYNVHFAASCRIPCISQSKHF